MKLLFYSLFLLTGIALLVAFRHPAASSKPTDTDTTKKAARYNSFYMDDVVELSMAIVQAINDSIPVCDKEFGIPGRRHTETLDPEVAIHTIELAADNGGRATGITYFDDFWWDDKIIVAITAEYDANTLKFNQQNGPYKYYNANIRVTYEVIVDGTARTGIYYEEDASFRTKDHLYQPYEKQ